MNMAKIKSKWKKRFKNLVKKIKNFNRSFIKKIHSIIKRSKKPVKVATISNNNISSNNSIFQPILIGIILLVLIISNMCTYVVVNRIMSDNIIVMKQYYDGKINHTEKEIQQIYKKLEKQSKNIANNKAAKKHITNSSFKIYGAKVYKGMVVHTIDKCKNFVFRTSNGIITLTESQYKKALCKYIIKYNPEKNPEYVNRVADGFIKLTRYFGENKNFVLYYVALCGVESGYKSNVVSCCGAQGIPQVMWSVWHGTAEKNWNINKAQFHNSIFNQLYVGMKIYEIQYKKYRNNIRLAHNAYSGGTPGYHVKVVRRYNELLSVMQSV